MNITNINMNVNKSNLKNNVVKSSRVFTIVDYPNVGETYGKYTGKYPGDAADKVLTDLAKKVNLKNTDEKNFIFFTIRDITPNKNNRNSKNNRDKEYTYIGTRVQLYEPVKLDNGRIVRYRNNITRLTKDKLSIYNIKNINLS